MLTQTERQGRVIAHLDMDCFYCQVEHLRLNIPQEEPLAVQQWQMLAAINYPAREKGIKRGDTAEFARKACPGIHLIHVETLETQNKYLQEEAKQKITLERYRKASAEILSIISSNCTRVERASIDEAYFELTEEVNFAIKHLTKEHLIKTNPSLSNPITGQNDIENDISPEPDKMMHVKINKADLVDLFSELKDENVFNIVAMTSDEIIMNPEDATNEELAILIGSICVNRIRKSIYDKLGYTSSAGISYNKLLSKIGSAKFKPNRQAIVLRRNKDNLLGKVSIRKLRGLGGKLGKIILGEFPYITTPRELQSIELSNLRDKYGEETGTYIWRLCRGISDDLVTPNLKPKSMLASKQFSPQLDLTLLQRWLFVMSEELNERILNDVKRFSRRPRTISLHHRRNLDNERSTRSRSSPIPRGSLEHGIPTVNEIYIAGCRLLDRIPVLELTPCVALGLGVYDFEDISTENNRITEYFKVKNDKTSKTKPSTSTIESPKKFEVNRTVSTPTQAIPKEKETEILEYTGQSDSEDVSNGSLTPEIWLSPQFDEHQQLSPSSIFYNSPIRDFPSTTYRKSLSTPTRLSTSPNSHQRAKTSPINQRTTAPPIYQQTLTTSSPATTINQPVCTSTKHLLKNQTSFTNQNQDNSLIPDSSALNPFGQNNLSNRDCDLFHIEEIIQEKASQETEESTLLQCEQCGQLLKSSEIQVHLDHHFAVHLSRQDDLISENKQTSTHTKELETKPRKRKTVSVQDKSSTKKTLDHYFKDFRKKSNN